ncbi:MAG: heat-inducible transcription repressor HrcA [Ruminococcaceae bacterium]|nr:heat-inducible transcription repressor HrcA [Oscillospiraceae bacterium]
MNKLLPLRRQQILSAIVEQYIETGEPVGSKALLGRKGMDVSSATIRNEMAELTKQGFITQPHTSAGRVPTQQGYRYYVDNLMEESSLSDVDRRRIEAGVDYRSGDPEILLDKVSEALVDFTNFAAISTTPADENAYIKNIEMAQISSKMAMIVLLTSVGILKSKACRTDVEITPELKNTFDTIVRENFYGRPLLDVNTVMIQTLVASLGADALSMSPLLVTIADLATAASVSEIKLDGQTNLFGHKEYDQNAGQLLDFLHRAEPLGMLVSTSGDSDNDIEVLIGSENRYKELENSSVIISKYRIGESATGAIGIIGPTRMNYSKLIPGIKYLTDIVSKVLSEVYEEEQGFDKEREESY